jgi:hypothetical protein
MALQWQLPAVEPVPDQLTIPAPSPLRPNAPNRPAPLPFRSTNADAATDAAFLELIKSSAAPTSASPATGRAGRRGAAAGAAAGPGGGAAVGTAADALMRLRLDPEDVAKMTRQGTTCVAWHPASGARPIVAASDKSGQVALWCVDYDGGGGGGGGGGGDGGGGDVEDGEGAGCDGILVFGAHREYVSAMRWVGRGAAARLLSASYDGSVRLLDVEKGA